MMLAGILAFAQATGRVEDKSGNGLVGAMVLDKDNGKWAVTDIDGNYSIQEASKGHTLEASCLGYTTLSVVFNGEKPFVIVLEEEALALDETVVIGYGSVKKKDLTGSVGVLDSKILEQQSVNNISQSLQGAVPGLQVTRSSSMPGASATLRVRGVTTMSENDPLIIVDGMAVSSIDNVATEDVEQITVLKDGAAASIYGARAAAGVILITTKGAKEGDLHISYNGEYSVIGATEWSEYLTDPINYMTMFNEYKWNDANNPVGGDYQTYSQERIENYFQLNAMDPIEYPNFDWKGAIVKPYANRYKHSLSAAYGSKNVKTRVSASYESTDGLYEGLAHEKMMARMRNVITVNKYLSADVDFSFRHAVKTNTQTVPLQAANMYPSIYLGLYPDGRIGPGKSGSNTLGIVKEGGYTSSRNDYVTGKFALTLKPVEGLDIVASYSPTFAFSKSKDWNKKVPYYDAYDTGVILGYLSSHQYNSLTESRGDTNTSELQFTANYEKRIGEGHNFSLMAGYEEFYRYHESVSGSSSEMTLSDFPYLSLANKDNLSVSGSSYEEAYRSFFGRFMYNYKSRYYLQANVRADGSARFAKGHRWGVFPSVSLGWVISNESWLENVKPISYLKLRASVGSLGNERIGSYYPAQASINTTNAVMFGAQGMTSQMTAAQVAIAIPDITWETTNTYDVGLDASFLDSRLGIAADYYYKETKDMLLELAIPQFTGYGSPNQNAGTMFTRGWEFKIDWHDRIGDFTYGGGFNISDYTSVMGNLNGKVVFGTNTIIKEGEEYNAWYGYKCLGIIQNEDQLLELPTQLIATLAPGDLAYADISGAEGEPDGKINADHDRVVLGSSLPHFVFGGNLNFGWKGIGLGVLFSGVGKQLQRVTDQMVRPFYSQWLSAPANLLNPDGTRNYFSVYNTDEQNAKAQYPRLCYTSAEKNNYMNSDYWLMDGSYLRIKNINLSYTFPKKMVQKASLQGLKVYFNVDDPFCFDHYLKGWDPEQGISTYIARTFTLGVDIKF